MYILSGISLRNLHLWLSTTTFLDVRHRKTFAEKLLLKGEFSVNYAIITWILGFLLFSPVYVVVPHCARTPWFQTPELGIYLIYLAIWKNGWEFWTPFNHLRRRNSWFHWSTIGSNLTILHMIKARLSEVQACGFETVHSFKYHLLLFQGYPCMIIGTIYKYSSHQARGSGVRHNHWIHVWFSASCGHALLIINNSYIYTGMFALAAI